MTVEKEKDRNTFIVSPVIFILIDVKSHEPAVC